MDLQQIVKEIKLHKKHGIVSKVSARTGISMPTVRKYLNGDVMQPKVLLVLNTAIDIINESNI